MNRIRKYLETPKDVKQRHHDIAKVLMLVSSIVFLAWFMYVSTLLANYITYGI